MSIGGNFIISKPSADDAERIRTLRSSVVLAPGFVGPLQE
jgi:hypothetical protein